MPHGRKSGGSFTVEKFYSDIAGKWQARTRHGAAFTGEARCWRDDRRASGFFGSTLPAS